MTSEAVRQRIMVGLFLAQSLFTAASAAAFTLGPIIAVDLAGKDSAAGLPSTLTLVGRALIAYPAGWLMDRIGRRLGLSLGFLLGIVAAVWGIVAIVQGSLVGFLIGALLFGGLRAVVEQGRFVAAEVHPAAQRARAIGIVVFAGTIGAVGGPLLVPPSEQWMSQMELPGTAGPFAVAALMLALALLIVFSLLRPDPLQIGRALDEALSPARAVEAPIIGLRTLFRRPALRFAVLVITISQLVMVMLMVVAPVHMDHFNHGTKVISWVIMAHMLGMFGLSGVVSSLISRVGHLATIAAGTTLLILAAVMTPLVAGVPLLALSLFLLGLGWNLCFIASSAIVADAASAGERGRVQGASEAMAALAAGVGGLGAGPLFDGSGLFFLGILSIGLCLLMLGATIFAALPGRTLQLAGDLSQETAREQL